MVKSEPAAPAPDLRTRSFAFAPRVVKLCQTLEGKPGVSRTLSHQLLRSGTSVGANVEEAHAAQNCADDAAKPAIARKEARETHYWLRLLATSNLVQPRRLNDLTDETSQLIAILTTMVKKCRRPAQ